MPVYLELFHGRQSVAEELQDWGSQGPILGPLAYVHTTYSTDIKVETLDGIDGVLQVVGELPDLLYYDGTYYGDWSVIGQEALGNDLLPRVQPFEKAKAQLPATSTTGPVSTESVAPTDTHTIDIRVIESWRIVIVAASPEEALAEANGMSASTVRKQATLTNCKTDGAELA
jgi:hypothetical protein